MTEFDTLVVNFKNNMALTATWLNADDQTDIQTASGPLPSLAKVIRTSTEQLNMLVPDISNRLRLDADGAYSVAQQAMGRHNLGLDRVDNTPDLEKPLSSQQQQALQNALNVANSKEDPKNRNVVGGYFAYDGARLPIRNGADSLFGYLYFNGTARRDWLLPDNSGTIALKSDITGNNSGINTGDETTATIKAKLGITTLSGANTGDETQASILNKLAIPNIAGLNTGDETHDSIIGKIGFDVMPLGARNANGGVAPLDENRLVPKENLPAAFESIVVFDNFGVIEHPGVEKRLYVTMAEGALYYWNGAFYVQLNAALNNTDNLAEGQGNLYFTQLRAIQSVLSTLDTTLVGDVTNTDTVVQAVGRLQHQIKAAIADYTQQISTLSSNTTASLATKEALANKAVNFNTVNDTLYPTVKAVKTVTDKITADQTAAVNAEAATRAQAVTDLTNSTNAALATKEILANKATDLTSNDNTHYPTTQAVKTAVDKVASDAATAQSTANTNTTTALATKENLSNKAVDFSVVDDVKYPTTKAVKTFLDVRLASAINDRGNWSAAGGTWPTTGGSKDDGSVKKGDMWYVSTAGTLGGVAVNIGDSFRALTDAPGQTAANWDVLESNIGYVPYNATNPAGYISGITNQMVLTALSIPSISGTNTGDETKASILTKLGATVVTGSNTGDETLATIQSKLDSTSNLPEGTNLYFTTGRVLNTALAGFAPAAVNADVVATDSVLTAFSKHQKQIDDLQVANTGINTGDETQTTILNKLGYTPANKAGDYITGLFGMNRISAIGPASTPNATNGLWHPLAIAMSDGLCLYTDEEFVNGYNGVTVYNNSGGSGVQLSIVADTQAPNASKKVVKVAYDGVSPVSPDLGGFIQQMPSAANKMFVQRFRAKIPVGYTVNDQQNSMGTNAVTYWLTPRNGTGKYEDYVRVSLCGDTGPFNVGGHVSLSGPAGTAVNWYLASCTCFDLTSKVINNGDETQTSILTKLGLQAISGLNTGDETTASIRSKLGITTLSGSNTGDETSTTILAKLNIPGIAGTNTGDETKGGILTKLGATTLTGSNTGDETQSTILSKLGQNTYRVVSVGSSSTSAPVGAGVYKNGTQVLNSVRSYNLMILRRSDAAVMAVGSYDVYDATNGPANATAMANVLNSYDANYVAVISTYDEPAANRLTGTLPAAMYRCGASRGKFGSSGFVYRGAYVLVGICGCGEGNGLEAYRGDVSSDANAWVDLGFALINGALIGVSGGSSGKSTFYSAPDNVITQTATTATTTLDLSAAAVFEVTLSANTTFAFDFSKVPALSSQLFAFVLTIFNDATSGRGVSFPAGTKWAGGQIPGRTTTANARDDWYFYSRDGINWIGSLSNQDVR